MRRAIDLPCYVLMSGCLLLGSPAWAADHIDSPTTTADPTADITDLYAFTSPEHPGRLVLAMTLHPNATPDTRFSDALQYVLRVRRAWPNPAAGSPALRVEDRELRVVCTADAGDTQTVTCAVEGMCAATAAGCPMETVRLGEIRAAADDPPLRVFAGLRAEPFFLDVLGSIATLGLGHLMFIGDDSVLAHVDSLALVVEIDPARLGLTPSDALLAVSSEIRVIPDASEVAP